MKQIASTYTYNKTSGLIVLLGVNIDRDQLLLVVNTTRNVTYYNFADSATTLQAFTQGVNTSVTLASSIISASSAHTNADALTIYYDDQISPGQAITVQNGIQEFLDVEGSFPIRVLNPSEAITVTANVEDPNNIISDGINNALFGSDQLTTALNDYLSLSTPVPITGTVTVGNSVTIGSLPNVKIQGFNGAGGGQYIDVGVTEQGAIAVVFDAPLPEGTAQIGSVTASLNLDANYVKITDSNGDDILLSDGNVPITGTVTVGNSVTIASLPAISVEPTAFVGAGIATDEGGSPPPYGVQLGFYNVALDSFRLASTSEPLPITGTVTASLDASGGVGPDLPIPSQGIQLGYNASGEFLGVSPENRLPVDVGDIVVSGRRTVGGNIYPLPVNSINEDAGNIGMPIGFHYDGSFKIVEANYPLPISGTVTANNTNLNRLVQDGEAAGTFGVPLVYAQTAVGQLDYFKEVNQLVGLPIRNDANPLVVSGTVTSIAGQGTTATNTNFISTTSAPLVSAVGDRVVLTVLNEGAGTLFINVGSGSATTTSYQVRLLPGDYWEAPVGQQSLQHSAIFATAGTARVTEVRLGG